MFRCFVALLTLAMSVYAQERPPQILQIYRDFLKPGSDASYRKMEEDAARICRELKCPHPYLAIESLTGPKEVWFFNGYGSPAEQKQVADDYGKSAPLLAALAQAVRGKDKLVSKPVETFANYRQDLSRGAPWILGRGRFLVITVTKSSRKIEGTVFEAPDGTRFIVAPAQTRAEGDAKSAAAGPETAIFAVRSYWSFPAKEWTAADPTLWKSEVYSQREN